MQKKEQKFFSRSKRKSKSSSLAAKERAKQQKKEQGAYDNMNHEILISILEKKIKDKDFLGLIKQGLK
ncbi:MAG: hypothetical protein ACT6RN_27255 [Agrobacterium sp.]|uniref:hypothetical protein n=1 Tax=Agrobacterium sp. TaxID=361 RepID=UPI004037F141